MLLIHRNRLWHRHRPLMGCCSRGICMTASSLSALCDKCGSPDEQLQALEHFNQQEASISRESIYYLLQEYTKQKDLRAGRQIQALMRRKQLDSVAVLGNHLIRLFASCGSLQEANEAFHRVSKPTVYTWNALMSAYMHYGDNERVFGLYQEMIDTFVKPDMVTYLYVLKACSLLGAIVRGWLIHDHIARDGVEANDALGNTLVDMYAKCGVLEEARLIFGRLSKHTLVSWGAIITGYSKHGQGLVAIDLFEKMQQEGEPPDKVIFLGMFKACVSIGEIEQGRQLHNQVISCGFDADLVTGNALVDMYAKLGVLEDAQNVFDSLSRHSLVSWSALIAGYSQHGNFSTSLKRFETMQERGVKPDRITYLCILRACSSMAAIKKVSSIHEQIMNSELNSDTNLLNAVIETYARCGSLDKALACFNDLQHPNVGSWDALIAGYVHNGDISAALKAFVRMHDSGFKWNELTLSCALKVCASNGDVKEGRVIHYEFIKNGRAFDTAIGNTLVDMYAKCGSLNEAHRVFDRMLNQNAVSWSVLMSGYVQHGLGLSALTLFQKMQAEGVMLNKGACSCAVKACGSIGALSAGRLVHEEITKVGYDADMIVGSSLVDMYVKCKLLDEAQKVFDRLHHRDVVSWAAMVAGYVANERGVPALRLFTRMQEEGVKPDTIIYLCILKACGSVGIVKHGELVLDRIIRDGFEDDLTMGNTIIDMYVKCGRLESARRLFDRLPTRNVVAWGAMIAGYAQLGNFEGVQLYLNEMQQAEVKPDNVIFTNILAACSHTGRLEEGRQFFHLMKEQHGIMANAEQYSCMIDLLGRAGCFKEAADYLESYPGSPDFITLVSLLSSCKLHGNVELGRLCFDQICQLNLVDASSYVLMFNVYGESQLWEEVDKLQKLRKSAHAWKKPGIAWIEVDNFVHELVIGGDNHPEIRAKLQNLNRVLKQDGYFSHLDSVMESMLDENIAVKAFELRGAKNFL